MIAVSYAEPQETTSFGSLIVAVDRAEAVRQTIEQRHYGEAE